MKCAFYLGLAVAALLSACARGPGDEAKAVEGNWRPVQAELGGQPMTEAFLRSIGLKLEKGRYEVLVGNEPDRGAYMLDCTRAPKCMTITGREGPNQGKIIPAVFEINGDTLRICYDLSGAQRPTEFKSVAGTQLFLVTYSRQKE